MSPKGPEMWKTKLVLFKIMDLWSHNENRNWERQVELRTNFTEKKVAEKERPKEKTKETEKEGEKEREREIEK